MADAPPATFSIPKSGFLGIEALIDLGADGLKKLAEAQASQPLTLAFSSLFPRLAEQIDCETTTIENAVVHALIPLNGLRRSMELAPDVFLDALKGTVADRTPKEWRDKHLSRWEGIAGELAPFFHPDNFFAQASKAFDLLVERPATFRGARILTELRPIYDEATTKTLASLQTNTLVLQYSDGVGFQSVHVTLDGEDLKTLEEELERAKKKIEVCRQEASATGSNLVVYGEPDANDTETD